jgi:uncharacterized protein Gcw-chp
MRKVRMAGGLALLMVGAVLPAAGQATIGFDVGLNSIYNWRGLSYTNKPVIQPDVWISAYGFTAGGWANVEPGAYTNDISENGSDKAGIAEIDGWIEYARTSGNVNWKLGWTIYTFDTNNSGLTAFYDTHEFYGQASISGLPITPQVYVAYDVDKVKGAYIAPSVSYGWKASPSLTINLGVLAGISAGQEFSANDPSFNFAKSGLTHVDVSASTSFAAGPLSIAPAFHVQFNHDPAVKVVSPTKLNEGAKFWGGVTLSWSHALGASKSE